MGLHRRKRTWRRPAFPQKRSRTRAQERHPSTSYCSIIRDPGAKRGRTALPHRNRVISIIPSESGSSTSTTTPLIRTSPCEPGYRRGVTSEPAPVVFDHPQMQGMELRSRTANLVDDDLLGNSGPRQPGSDPLRSFYSCRSGLDDDPASRGVPYDPSEKQWPPRGRPLDSTEGARSCTQESSAAAKRSSTGGWHRARAWCSMSGRNTCS